MVIVKEEKLGRGPWKRLLDGTWDNHRICFLTNPDKQGLYVIEGKKKAQLVLSQYFIAGDNAAKFASESKATLLVKSQQNFLILSASAVNVDETNAEEKLEEMFWQLDNKKERLLLSAKKARAELSEIKDEPNQANLLFNPPDVLATALAPAKTSKKAVLGKNASGEKIELDAPQLEKTIIQASGTEKTSAMKVIIENNILVGNHCIVFDENADFAKMSVPNSDQDAEDASGMPLKNAEASIDLNFFSPAMLNELFNVKNRFKEKTRSIEELIQRNSAEENEDKSESFRTARLLKATKTSFPGLFGKTDASRFLSQSPSIMRVDISKLPEGMRLGAIYSVLRSISEETAETHERFIACHPQAEKIVSNNPNHLQNAIMRLLGSRLGFCLGTDNEAALNETIRNAAVSLTHVENTEFAVTGTIRPFRISLRQSFSA